MAQWGLSGKAIPSKYPYADQINKACINRNVAPCALYAIAWRETISVESWILATYGVTAQHFISFDNGHGVYQLTDSFPPNWDNVEANCEYAIDQFYNPYVKDWLNRGELGDRLLKLAADDYNAGDRRVQLWHSLGNADMATTGHNYGSDIVQVYHNLLNNYDINFQRPS